MAAEVRPIRTKRDYEAALKEVERLWGAKAGTPRGDRLDVLATLIDAYEAEHYPMDHPDPIEAIKFRMEQQGLTRRDLEDIIGTRTRVAEVLNRKRGLSIAMIRRLHQRLGISDGSARLPRCPQSSRAGRSRGGRVDFKGAANSLRASPAFLPASPAVSFVLAKKVPMRIYSSLSTVRFYPKVAVVIVVERRGKWRLATADRR